MLRRRPLVCIITTILLAVCESPGLSAANAATSPDTIFGSATPTTVNAGDGNSVNVGVKFQASEAGSITGVRFYKASSNVGAHVVALWSSSGSELAQANSSGETASGWQAVNFATPVSITAGTTYVASYLAPDGHYSFTYDGLGSNVVNGPLEALGNATSADGVYAYSSSTSFPINSHHATNYYVDVDFIPASNSTSTSSTSTSTSSTSTSTSSTSTSTSTTSTATSTTSTATSTTSTAANAPDVIFGSATPTTVDSGDGNSVNVGVKFQASEAGSITGVRFYKASTNVGTHVVALWSSSGSELAQANSSGETASGWQAVNFAAPVSITAGTTYVASYLAPDGHYSFASEGLSSNVVNGPLEALGNATSADGVYAYSSSTSFPINGYQATNYYVDVDFVPASSTTPTTPQSTVSPVISGLAQAGQTLTVSNGTWTGSPTGYGYHWQDCDSSGANCMNIADATSQSYVVGTADEGFTIEVVVAATNASGSTSESSAPTVVVGSAGGAYSFDDEFNGSSANLANWRALDEQGDTSNSEIECYLPSQVAESGGYLTESAAYVSAGFTCPAGTPLSRNPLNYESGDVQMKTASFTYGTVVVNAEMAGNNATTWPAIWLLGAACQTSSTAPYSYLSGTSSTSTGYYCPWDADSSDAAEVDIQENNGTALASNENVYNSSGGSGTNHCTAFPAGEGPSTAYHTYELDWSAGSLVFKVDGQTECTVTGAIVPSRAMFLIIDTAIATSGQQSSQLPQTTSVDYVRITSATMPVNSAVPAISGTAQVGDVLTASTGSWTNSPSSYTCQWQQDDTTDIAGATSSTYTPVAGDAGHTLDVIVTAHNGTTAAGSQASAATTTVSSAQ